MNHAPTDIMTSPDPTQVTIDLSAIRHNYREIRRVVPDDQRILCVVKSNAYGHGLGAISTALVKEGANFFGVRDIDEGKTLRHIGIKAPILLLLGLVDGQFEELVRFELTPVIYELETAQAFNNYLERHEQIHPIHIKVDTGMTRLGVPAEDVPVFMDKLRECPQLKVEGILSHLADATDPAYTARQAEAWQQVRNALREWPISLWHVANSIGAVQQLFPETNLVRAGLVLYGVYPDPVLQTAVDLKPALSWTSEIIDLKTVPAGTAVSYGCSYRTERRSRIAVLPVGYADGYPRLLSNRGSVLIRSQRAPIVGRVCMDLTMVDATDIPGVEIGDRVTLMGTDGAEQILADDLAQWAETISYEILARIAARVPRRYTE